MWEMHRSSGGFLIRDLLEFRFLIRVDGADIEDRQNARDRGQQLPSDLANQKCWPVLAGRHYDFLLATMPSDCLHYCKYRDNQVGDCRDHAGRDVA